jgi:branched-chain amino acid transport system permease protein
MYVVLGLGLNIVVGVAGLLDLGYVAFYAVGAYSYALLHLISTWGSGRLLPMGGLLGALFGLLLGFPVLRLRGDYLAIVTLGFGEIIRLVLENWSEFSQGTERHLQHCPAGPVRHRMSLDNSIVYLLSDDRYGPGHHFRGQSAPELTHRPGLVRPARR